MIVLSRSLLLGTAPSVNLRAPVILWDSIVTPDAITASSSDEDFPVTNLATDSTIEIWRAATDDDEVTIEITGDAAETIDAIGIARHNFGSTQATVSVEVPSESVPEVWVEVIEPGILADDSPVLFRFEPMQVQSLRLRIQPSGTAPSAAVLYAGKLLVMPHGITAGHVPLDQALQTQVVNGVSEAGNYLGRIITGQSAQTSAHFELLPIDWYYEEMEAFVARGKSGPFFFAWLPSTRPDDVGFSWLKSDPQPTMGSIYFDLTLDYGGIVR